jgi:F-type H+-transporting ATPase subunit b
MKVNWFTVIAQIINFLILVWLLKRYLYKPILNAVAQRESKIEKQLQEAANKENEAEKEKAEFELKNALLEQQKTELMNQAVAENNHQRAKFLEEARNEANVLRAKLEESLNEVRANMQNEVAHKIHQEVLSITQKALSSLASASLEEQSVNILIKHLNELKEDEKLTFISAFKSGINPILVRSAFNLPPDLQRKIQDAIAALLGTSVQIQYSLQPELISGIELTSNGYKLAWSISAFLDSLEKDLQKNVQYKQ